MSITESEMSKFAESLPQSYRARYAPAEIQAHCQLALSRGDLPLELGIFRRTDELTGICVVAADQPGLLSKITEALVLCELDIVNANAFTRETDSGKEAVDIFWLRKMRQGLRPGAFPEFIPCDEADADRLRQTLNRGLRGDLTPSPTAVQSPVTSSDSRVRFLEDSSGALSTLELETDDRSGLLLALSRALFAQQVQIVHSEVRTNQGRVVDRFQIAELDGKPVSEGRRLEIQVAVLTAAEPAKRLSSAPPNKKR